MDDDADHGEWEAAGLERRRNEQLVTEDVCGQRPEHREQRGMVITGTCGEVRVAVCDHCMCDITLTGVNWQGCHCGAYRCGSCPRDSCRACRNPRWSAASVRDAVAQWERLMFPSFGESSRSAAPDEPTEAPLPMLPPSRGMPTVIAMDTDDGGVAAANGDDRSRLRCRACDLPASALPSGTSWRVCRCGSSYCQWCLEGGCVDCLVREFWRGDFLDDPPTDSDAPQPEPQRQRSAIDTADPGSARAQHAEFDMVPCAITPEEARARRMDLREKERVRLAERRAASRIVRRDMERAGTRPKRERSRRGTIRFVSANVNCADRMLQELQWGSCFKRADYLAIQEVRRRGDDVGRVTSACRDLGWEAICDEAYLKVKQAGGGTATLVKKEGLRPLAAETGDFLGRLTLSLASALRYAVFGSHYGVTGGKVADQLALWRHLAARLTALGRPFVVGGDWQVDPGELELIKFADSLGAAVCHPNAVTNTQTNTRIDFSWCRRCSSRVAGEQLSTTGVHFRPTQPCSWNSTLTWSTARPTGWPSRSCSRWPIPWARIYHA